jgi:PAS domain S-box-containing protein
MPAKEWRRMEPGIASDEMPGPEAGAAAMETRAPNAALPSDCSMSIHDSWLGKIASAEALFITDERQRVRAWSATAQSLLGYAPEEVVGQPCFGVLMGREPEGHPVCSASCPVTRNARRGRGTASYEVMATAKDGTPRYFTNSVLVIEGGHGAFRVVHMMRESCQVPPSRPASPPAFDSGVTSAEALTRRELEVLRLFARGLSLEQVACELSISTFTARNHSTTIQHKLAVRNRLQMVLEGIRRGLV